MNGQADNGGVDESASAPDRQAAMIDLLEHLAGKYWGYSRVGTPRLLPGEIAEQFGDDVPIPESGRVVGSAVWKDSAMLIIDCDLNADETERFYAERLVARGWTIAETDQLPSDRGFTGGGVYQGNGVYFCSGEDRPYIHLQSFYMQRFSPGGKPRTVHLTWTGNSKQSPCSREYRSHMQRVRSSRPPEILPELHPPAGAILIPGGTSKTGGTNGSCASSSALLLTNLAMSALRPHYDEQLASAGWRRTDREVGGAFAWSGWDFTDNQNAWHALLTIVGQPWSPGQYRLDLYAEDDSYGKIRDMFFGTSGQLPPGNMT